jgi:hypothetical protein
VTAPQPANEMMEAFRDRTIMFDNHGKPGNGDVDSPRKTRVSSRKHVPGGGFEQKVAGLI